MLTESQTAFAKRMEVNKSTVTRWKDAGRLVMAGRKVDVESSMEMIQQTSGSRDDVAKRHELEREEKRLLEKEAETATTGPDPDRQAVREQLRGAALKKALGDARIKQAEADLREMERDLKAGNLIAREDVDYELTNFGAQLRVMLDGRADRIGAEQGFRPTQIVALSEDYDQILLELSDELRARGDTPS